MGERLLLDTHTLIWAAIAPEKLTAAARAALVDPDNQIFVSAVSAMEIATKVRIGKVEEARPLATGFVRQIEARGFTILDLTAEHGELAGGLAIPHQDPFDRLLIAQAQIEQLRFVSNEARFDTYGVRRLW
ncbi:twitching motility protein PilT [alpha proteobacterium AAP81b]|nr:twitching motility protein PilT [alpha proteobacterium AAP81b]